MSTFAERLKKIIKIRGISQTEVARLSGISQQSINYIINNNLESSKLAPKIAEALNINPEWLLFEKGKIEETRIYELPIIHSGYMLKKFLAGALEDSGLSYVVVEMDLGPSAFAYLYEPKTLLICFKPTEEANTQAKDFFIINPETGVVTITDQQSEGAFVIYEWRKRHVDF